MTPLRRLCTFAHVSPGCRPRPAGGLLLWLAGLLLAGFATATPRITAPGGRLVVPGEFVTLVFRVVSNVDIEVDVRADTREGWTILRQPGSVRLEGGRTRPIAVTVAVPTGAPAGLEERVRLTVEAPDGIVEAEVQLTVAELRDLSLEVPELVVLDDEDAKITVRNRGNVPLDVRLELRLGGELIDDAEAQIAPQQSVVLMLTPTAPGIHELRLEGAGEPLLRPLSVVRFGVPDPEPPEVLAAAEGTVATGEPTFGARLLLSGRLSDFVAVDARIDSRPELSFLEVRGISEATETTEATETMAPEPWRVRLGRIGSAPFQLPLPAMTGALVQGPDDDDWEVAVAGGVAEQRAVMYTAALRLFEPTPDSRLEVAFGGGLAPEGLRLVGRSSLEVERLRVGSEARLQEGELDWSVRYQRTRPLDEVLVRAEAALQRAFGLSPALLLEGSTRDRNGDELYAGVRLGFGKADSSWRVGGVIGLPSELPGRLRQELQLGSDTSFAVLRHDMLLGNGWQTQNSVGLVRDVNGEAFRVSTAWLRLSGPANALQANADLRLDLADNTLSGRVAGQAETQLGPVAVQGGVAWLPADGAFDLSFAGTYQHDPFELALELALRLEPALAPSVSATLEGRYALPLRVPEQIVELAGGRRLGTLELRVQAPEGPLAGVAFRVGRYRVETDADGLAVVRLEPGKYRVEIELGTVPVTYAVPDDSPREIEIGIQTTTTLTFDAIRTAQVRGRVLEDADADGVADSPERGVEARLLLIEANGVVRNLRSGSDGLFTARGVLPGQVELRLVEAPFGSSVVGAATRTLILEAGQVAEPVFLIRPAAAVARDFGGDAPRIQQVAPQADRVPPGAAPIIEVTVRGEAELVTLMVGNRTVPMRQDGELWRARLPVPTDSAAGVLPFTVTARNAAGERSRQGQLIIDPTVPLLELVARGPVEPGERLELQLNALAAVARAEATSPVSEPIALTPLGNGSGAFVGELVIAADAEDAIYEATASGELADGTPFTVSARFRVIVP